MFKTATASVFLLLKALLLYRKNRLLLLALFTAVTAGFNLQAQPKAPYFQKTNNFGGSTVTDLAAFAPALGDFTLEVQGTAGTAVTIAGLGISHTPAATGQVRFVCQNNIIYVYESKVYIRKYAAIPQGVATGSNLLLNPGFEAATLLGTGRWSANNWDALTDTKASAWGTGASTSVREGTNVSEGLKSLIFHSNARYLTQQLPAGALASNTLYQLSYNYWTSSGAGNGDATYQLLLGTSSAGSQLKTLLGHTTSASDYTIKSFSTIFQTPAIPSGEVWLTLFRNLSKVDWLDNLKLTAVSGLTPGMTGAGTATYLAGTAYAPEDLTLAEQGGNAVNITTFIPPAADFTLEAEVIAGTAISIPSIGIEHTPASSGLLRLVHKNNTIFVFENGILVTRYTPVAQYTVEETNLLTNPSFESVTVLGAGRWTANNWNALTDTKTSAWGIGTSTSVREEAPYLSDGSKTLIMHSNVRYLTQNLAAGAVTSNTWYILTYDYWTSAGAGNGGATYQVQLGTGSTASDVQSITGHTTSTTENTRQRFSTLFQTSVVPANLWFTLYRNSSKVDWLDNLKLAKVNNLTPGITGVSGATIITGSAMAPLDEKYDAYERLQETIAYATRVLGWYSDNQAKKDIITPAITAANVALSNTGLTLEQINQAITDLSTATKSVDKKIYVPTWMLGNVTDPENNWSYSKSAQSKDFILFWEKGFNTENPNKLFYNGTKCDVDWIFDLAERSFRLYADSLKFIRTGSSKTDTYKMVIRLRYSGDWEASGSGVDDMIGLLTLTPSAYNSRGGQTVAHEVGHCFQYQVHCDNNNQNGWMYGFGANTAGGNGWWEQCAQWMGIKMFPSQQFANEWFSGYLSNAHKHPLHEAPRYNNFYIQDYWSDLHGKDIIGRLWNESFRPEDPIETYKRITGLSQPQFNDEMYDNAARFASWDTKSLRADGASRIGLRPQPRLNDAGNNFWKIDPSACVENYGHNIIQLNAPLSETLVSATFEGMAGASGYRQNFVSEAGWRYGFVALLNNGTRVYSEMQAADMSVNDGKGTLTFTSPANCARLWFVVSGAPKSHWRHAWDDNDANDEQWPYMVAFGNTNLLGRANVPLSIRPEAVTAKVKVFPNPFSNTLQIDTGGEKGAFYIRDITGRTLQTQTILGGNKVELQADKLQAGIYFWQLNGYSGKIIKQ